MSSEQPPKEYYPITEHELNLIKNDCLHPELDNCPNECTAWNDEEGECDFSANALMDTILARNPCPHPAQARSGCDGCRKETEHLDCPTPGHCDQMKCPICCEGSDFPTLPEEIKKYEAEAARQAREDVLKELKDWTCKNRTQVTEWNDGLPFVWWYLLRDEIDFLRSTTPQSEQEGRER